MRILTLRLFIENAPAYSLSGFKILASRVLESSYAIAATFCSHCQWSKCNQEGLQQPGNVVSWLYV
jgi:hypothetical protein